MLHRLASSLCSLCLCGESLLPLFILFKIDARHTKAYLHFHVVASGCWHLHKILAEEKPFSERVSMIGHQLYAVVVLDFVLAMISGQEESRTGVTPVAPRSEAGVVKLFNGKDMTGLYTWLR